MKAVSATRKRGTVGKVSSCRKGINGTQEVMAAKAKPSSMTDPVTPTGG
jgi:hypothetical protein